jgi:hypothetical protein
MHPVEEDGRFVIQPVYPDRQSCAEGEEHEKNDLLVQDQFSIAYRLGIIY